MIRTDFHKNSLQASMVSIVVSIAETPCCFLASIMSSTLVHFLLVSSQTRMADLTVNPTELLPS